MFGLLFLFYVKSGESGQWGKASGDTAVMGRDSSPFFSKTMLYLVTHNLTLSSKKNALLDFNVHDFAVVDGWNPATPGASLIEQLQTVPNQQQSNLTEKT